MKKSHSAVAKRRVAIRRAVEQIGEDPDDELAFKVVECGLHSGFPLCCIAFFVKVWLRWTMAPNTWWAPGETVEELLNRADPLSAEALVARASYEAMMDCHGRPQYIPCPRCLLDQCFVRIRKCDWHLTARERRGPRRRRTRAI